MFLKNLFVNSCTLETSVDVLTVLRMVSYKSALKIRSTATLTVSYIIMHIFAGIWTWI